MTCGYVLRVGTPRAVPLKVGCQDLGTAVCLLRAPPQAPQLVRAPQFFRSSLEDPMDLFAPPHSLGVVVFDGYRDHEQWSLLSQLPHHDPVLLVGSGVARPPAGGVATGGSSTSSLCRRLISLSITPAV